ISRIFHVNINCSDVVRSKAFYEEFVGLKAGTHTLPDPQPVESFRIALGQWDAHMLDDGTPGAPVKLDLLEWKQPRPLGRPYAAANHLGIFRLAMLVPDIEAAYTELQAKGIPCWSPPEALKMGPGLPTVKALLFSDPDGTTLELIESPRRRAY